MRNCWCNSNKLAIDCCLRSKKTPNFAHKEIKLGGKVCLHLDCSLSAICSHNIPCAQLKILSPNSFFLVYECAKEFLDDKDKYPSFKKIGINDIGTFRGFCKVHDSEIFRSIDSSSFEINIENIFLTNYRAVCYNFSKVQNASNTHFHYKERVANFYDNIDHKKLAEMVERGNISSEKDLPYLKENYSKIYVNKSYENLEYCIVYLKNRPWFLLNSVDAFVFDLRFNELTYINLNNPIEELCTSVQMLNEGAVLMFSHLNINENDFFAKLVEDMDKYTYSELQKKLMLYVISHGLGMAINPSALTEEHKKTLSFLFQLNMDNLNPRDSDVSSLPLLEFSKIKYKIYKKRAKEIEF